MNALLIFTYGALFFSLSATISSLILTDEFGELPVRASRKANPEKQGTFDSSAASLLEVYGARKSWRWVMWHCACLACVIYSRTYSLTSVLTCVARVVHARRGVPVGSRADSALRVAAGVGCGQSHRAHCWSLRDAAFAPRYPTGLRCQSFEQKQSDREPHQPYARADVQRLSGLVLRNYDDGRRSVVVRILYGANDLTMPS